VPVEKDLPEPRAMEFVGVNPETGRPQIKGENGEPIDLVFLDPLPHCSTCYCTPEQPDVKNALVFPRPISRVKTIYDKVRLDRDAVRDHDPWPGADT